MTTMRPFSPRQFRAGSNGSTDGVEDEIHPSPARGRLDSVRDCFPGGIDDDVGARPLCHRTLRLILDGPDDAGPLPAGDHYRCGPHTAGRADNEDSLPLRDVAQLDQR